MSQTEADKSRVKETIVVTIPGKSSSGDSQNLLLELTMGSLRCTIENAKYPNVKNVFDMEITDKNLEEIRGFTRENREAKVYASDGTFMTIGNPSDGEVLSVMIHKPMDPVPTHHHIIEMCQVNVPQQSLKNVFSSYWH